MFAWRYDEETGGILIDPEQTAPPVAMREPRPVYAKELRMRGFERALELPEDDAVVAWLELGRLYVKGTLIGKFKAHPRQPIAPEDKRRSLLTLADFEPVDKLPPALAPVDLSAMCEKNKPAFARLMETASARIVETMKAEGFDRVYVSYSGGKDSEALLEVALRAVACDRLQVVFGDTSMEYPATYESAARREKDLEGRGVRFARATAPYTALESWRIFGAPSRARRWCCSVHKTDPINALTRKDLSLRHSLCLCGVRRSESLRRMRYEYIDRGAKCAGEVVLYPLLDWSAPEVWNVLFATNAPVNELYKQGQRRVGCIYCPMGGAAPDLAPILAPEQSALYEAAIEKTRPSDPFFLTGEHWRARRTGDHSDFAAVFAKVKLDNGVLYVCKERAIENWNQWFKLLPTIKEVAPGRYEAQYKGNNFEFVVDANQDRVLVFIPKRKYSRFFAGFLRRLVVRATYCVGCGHCVAQCERAALSIDKSGVVTLTDDCAHCLQCVEDACKRFYSLEKTNKDKRQIDLKQYGLEEWAKVQRS